MFVLPGLSKSSVLVDSLKLSSSSRKRKFSVGTKPYTKKEKKGMEDEMGWGGWKVRILFDIYIIALHGYVIKSFFFFLFGTKEKKRKEEKKREIYVVYLLRKC